MKKNILKTGIFIFILLAVLGHQKLAAIELSDHSPDAPVFFIKNMTYMLKTSPHFFPFNSSFFIEGYNTGINTGGAFNNGRANVFASTILPIPFVEWLAISGNFIGAFDFFDPSGGVDEIIEVTSENGALNYYANLGVTLDFSAVTLGLFGGIYSDIMKDAQDVPSILDVGREFKLTFIPIVKTAYWLSFLEIIANYINFGSFDKKNNLDFGQRYTFSPIDIHKNSLNIELYFNNERYSSFARNWIYGVDLKYGKKFFASIDTGYRDFYDFPAESYMKDSFFARLTLGYENDKEYEKNNYGNFDFLLFLFNHVNVSGFYDFQGFGIGINIGVLSFLEISTDIAFKEPDFSAFRLKIRFFLLDDWFNSD